MKSRKVWAYKRATSGFWRQHFTLGGMRYLHLSNLNYAEVPPENSHNIGIHAKRGSLDCGPLETFLRLAGLIQGPHWTIFVSIPHLLPRMD